MRVEASTLAPTAASVLDPAPAAAAARPGPGAHGGDVLRELDVNLLRSTDNFARLGPDHAGVPDLAGTSDLFTDTLRRQRTNLQPFLTRYPSPALSRRGSDGGS